MLFMFSPGPTLFLTITVWFSLIYIYSLDNGRQSMFLIMGCIIQLDLLDSPQEHILVEIYNAPPLS